MRTLSDAGAQSGGKFDLVLVFPEEVAGVEDFLKTNDLAIEVVRRVSLRALAITRAPLFVITEHNGEVAGAWEGTLNASEQAVVLGAISGG